VALYENTVIVPTLDAKLIALDATTGKQVWESTVADYGRVLPQQPAARRQGPPHHRPRRPRGDGHPRMAMLLVAGFVGSGEARQAKTLAEIKASKAVTVCADPDNLPFSSRNPGAPGYDVEVMRLVAVELGAEAEFKWGRRSCPSWRRNVSIAIESTSTSCLSTFPQLFTYAELHELTRPRGCWPGKVTAGSSIRRTGVKIPRFNGLARVPSGAHPYLMRANDVLTS